MAGEYSEIPTAGLHLCEVFPFFTWRSGRCLKIRKQRKNSQKMEKPYRPPNYKVGWIQPGKVAALTHFHADIRPEDVAGVMQASTELLQQVSDDFDLVIDNRVAPIDHLYPLAQLQQSASIFSHPHLRNLIIIKPMRVAAIAEGQRTEKSGKVTLYHVASVEEALATLSNRTDGSDPGELNHDFFPELES
jgi:hypothetical protein